MINTLVNRCGGQMMSSLFPYDVENRFWVILINMVHIVGVIIIQIGIFFPTYLIKIYIIYLILLLISYILLNNRCFMTVLANYFGKVNYNSLCIKMDNAKGFVIFYLIIAIIFLYYPEYSIYNLFINKKKI